MGWIDRRIWLQALFLGSVLSFLGLIFNNVQTNLETRNIHSGFRFMAQQAGFEIGETPWLVSPSVSIVTLGLIMILVTLILQRWNKRRTHSFENDVEYARLARQNFYFFWLPWIGVMISVVLVAQRHFGVSEWLEVDVFDSQKSYLLAFLTGAANSLKVSGSAAVAATLLGLLIGLCRTAPIVSMRYRVSSIYVNLIRNVPLLVQLVFWYALVLHGLPQVESSWQFGSALVNNRGIFLPVVSESLRWGEIFSASFAFFFLWRWACFEAEIRRNRSGRDFPVHLSFFLLGLATVVIYGKVSLSGAQWELPELVFGGRNVRGGWNITPEFLALAIGLGVYTAAFIAEITRAGVASVSAGQVEAARALGLKPFQIVRKIIMPQGLRFMIPPLTSQYLNCIKNSSLAVAVGYPDVVAVGGVILNQSGQAIEVIAMLMAFYLVFNLLTSVLLNILNRRLEIVGR